jgi:hypothetical protein
MKYHKCLSVYWSQGDHTSVIPVWKLTIIVTTGYWISTESYNSTQLLPHGNNLLYWMMVTGYPQKHTTALSYCHMAITCFLDDGYWVLTESYNSTQLLPHGNNLLYWMMVTGYSQKR